MATQAAAAPGKAPKPQVYKQVRHVLRVAGPWSNLLYATGLCGAVASVAGVVLADLSAKLANAMLARDFGAFMGLVLPLVLLRVGDVILTAVQQLLSGRLGQETADRLRRGAAARLCRTTAAAASSEHSGQVLSRLSNDLASTQSLVETDVPSIFTGSLRAALAMAYMLWKDWLLALVAVFGAPLVFMIVGKLNTPVMALSRRAQEKLAEAGQVTSEALSGAETVRSYGLQDRMYGAFRGHVEMWLDTMRRYSRLSSFAAAIGFGASFTPFILVFGIGGFMVLRGRILMGTMLAFMDLLNYVSFPMQQLPRHLTQMASNAASAERVLELLDAPVETGSGRDFRPDPGVPALELRDVTFTYPGASVPALSCVSFTANQGETVAIAGASGSGKTTVFRLLLRDYEPDSGEVLVFGHPLREWSPANLRRHFSYVSQNTYLFPFSVAENLRLEKEGLGEEELRAAARLAQADDFIASLPRGYETPLGELGNRISGGERQRLSLARALLRRSEILLLDEATSALDYRSERQVIRGIRDSLLGVTTLIIAHRLSSVQHADRIVVFDAKGIAESGTHEELMARKGKYHQLYSIQEEGGERA